MDNTANFRNVRMQGSPNHLACEGDRLALG